MPNKIDTKTYLAVGELVQAAAHLHGLTGPIQFTVQDDDDDRYDDFYDDDNCGDCGECYDCFEENMQNCGMMPDGGCMLAGTEYCDWDCKLQDLENDDPD